jgi:membrane protein required for colicin V production
VIDVIVLIFVGLAAILGLVRGVVSQLMSIGGLAAAYLLAPSFGGGVVAGFVRHHLGCSKFMAGKVSILVVGLAIYLCFRLVGYGIEKLLVGRVGQLKSLNRTGGAALGALKAVAVVAIIFFFLALVPRENMRAWFPKIMESRTYQLAARYNPMGQQAVLERMRDFRTSVADPSRMEKLRNSDEIGKLLSRYDLKGALEDQRFVESVREGDFDRLAANEQVERLMRDDQLTSLLSGLQEQPVKN